MKKLLILSCFTFLFSCENKKSEKINIEDSSPDSLKAFSGKDSVTISDMPENIEEIKAEYVSLNGQLKAQKLDSASISYECEERSGTVVFYTLDGELRSIKHSFAEYSHFSSMEQYYLKNDGLFFILKKNTAWIFDGGSPEKPETKDNIEEQRIYIVHNKPIECLEKKYTLKSSSENNPNPENIQNIKSKDCAYPELQKTFEWIVKIKEKNGKISCAQ